MSISNRRRRRHAMAVAALATISTALGGGIAAGSGEEVTISWWHLQNNPPGSTDWQNMADAFMAEHDNIWV